ncbi:MAG: carboxypeptidase regulatory-like domain-containing protein [Planctomycetota bacterium]
MRRACLLLALAAACSEPDFWAISSGSGGTKAVAIWVSDSPVDSADELFVTIDSVELGPEVLSSARREVELLSLRNGRRALLASAQVRAGTYARIVLRVSASRLGDRALDVLDRVVEIEGPFAIDRDTELLVDFNARMSVLGDTLRPVCTAADLATARFLDGSVVDERGDPVADAVVSAQRAGDEVCSGRTDADGGFRLGPVPPAPLTLVATARGRGIATGTGPVLVLRPEETGDLSGSAAGSYVRLMQGGSLIAVAGIERGAFTFRQVPNGSYDLEVWGAGGLLEVRTVDR